MTMSASKKAPQVHYFYETSWRWNVDDHQEREGYRSQRVHFQPLRFRQRRPIKELCLRWAPLKLDLFVRLRRHAQIGLHLFEALWKALRGFLVTKRGHHDDIVSVFPVYWRRHFVVGG